MYYVNKILRHVYCFLYSSHHFDREQTAIVSDKIATKWKTRFASCLDGPCLKLYAISVDQHNCQQMDSTFVAVADFPYFFHFLKSVEAGNLFNGKAPNLWSFRISVSQANKVWYQHLPNIFIGLFVYLLRSNDLYLWSFKWVQWYLASNRCQSFFFVCCVCLFVCLFEWLKLDCLYFVVFEWLISLVFEIFQY